ncbi:putative peptidyl-prolyl cis-trans isomerase [Gregarina niphandrodes]|uniref:peptidylprolyl isomerase n=1 Tax=Gregarina niphandrodes TaxID=110365 RepID=A0A023B5Y5_GRENI|nr:putative peptidyl-prolyl cis-trans isomerase [Gregarina niphandrodes]EZG64343.1 putative peptidyl-prolyl cis-trans isomerase [Gregarina niphandrodes]|eukprot:XP_011130643.1 putative peptidyl-prolyl cis-trans isomerase [Gregarina niphandrodes]
MENNVVDLLGNGKVVKTILLEGSGETPAVGCQVKVHYTGTLTDGKKFDSSIDRGTPFEFALGQGQVIKGWDVCVMSMKKGEKCRVELQPDFAYGEHGSPPTIPPNAVLVFEIELLEFSTRKVPEAMSMDEKLTAAGELKEEGTALFKDGKLGDAVRRYLEAAGLLENLENWPEDKQPEARKLAISTNLNVALVHIKLENWIEATIACAAVLRDDPTNVKALYRRAIARTGIQEFELAINDLKQALQIDPENMDVKKQITITNNKRKQQEAKTRSMYQRMF